MGHLEETHPRARVFLGPIAFAYLLILSYFGQLTAILKAKRKVDQLRCCPGN